MKWLVRLDGDDAILAMLTQTDQRSDYAVQKFETEFILDSIKFSGCKSSLEVLSKASEIIATLNGMLFLQYEIQTAIKIGPVYRVKEDGKRDIFLTVEPTVIKIRGHEPTIIIKKPFGEKIIYKPGQQIFKKLSKVQDNEKAKKIFRLIQNGDFDFANIYKILEVILSDKGIKIYKWVPENKISLLKRTANHDKAIGDKARHGIMNKEAPPKPMTLNEAQSIARILIDKFIDEITTD